MKMGGKQDGMGGISTNNKQKNGGKKKSPLLGVILKPEVSFSHYEFSGN